MLCDWCRLYLSSQQTDLSINRIRRQKNGGQNTSWSHTIFKEPLPLNLVKSVTLGARDYTVQQEASSLGLSVAEPPLPNQRAPEKSDHFTTHVFGGPECAISLMWHRQTPFPKIPRPKGLKGHKKHAVSPGVSLWFP